jgi:hypothetical protein
MNVILVLLPIATNDVVTLKINDFWTLTCSCLYTAADNLLDMLFLTAPMEVSDQKDFFVFFCHFIYDINSSRRIRKPNRAI